jgi:hypothetical protein
MGSLPPGVDPCTIPASQSPDGSPPNFEDPESMSTATITVSCVFIFLTTVFVCARVWINWLRLRLSDYFTIFAFVLHLGFLGNLISLHKFHRHLWDVPICWMDAVYLKQLYAHMLMFGMILLFSKAAIFLLYLEIFGTNRRTRFLIYGGLVFTILFYSTFIPMASYFNAPHAGQSWELLLAQMTDMSKAMVVLQWSLVIGAGSSVLDFYILALPLPIVWRLQVSKGKRYQLVVVFGTALLGVISSVVALVYRVYLITNTADNTWHQASLAIANTIENSVAIMVGSAPAFAHFFRVKVAETGLWKSVVSSFGTTRTGQSSQKSSNPGGSWLQTKHYGLRAHEHKKDGYELSESQKTKSTVGRYDRLQDEPRVGGQSPEGIVRTVDIFQHAHKRPDSTEQLV